MVGRQKDRSIPEFVFICGAVGSGNTFLFNCLTQDEDVYGINEDAFGSTLERLLESEKSTGKCPHTVDAFVEFLYTLRRDRRTLILKTPSNIRRMKILRKYLPDSRFIVMIRDPHAAIVSGLTRHEPGTGVEKAARLWLSESRYYKHLAGDSMVVGFEELVRNPIVPLQRISDRILPLSEAVFSYARRLHRPERADKDRWKTKVGHDVQKQVEHWAQVLGLEQTYQTIAAMPSSGIRDPQEDGAGSLAYLLWRPFIRVKKEFFRARYRLLR